jgi:hypothetical protein
LIEQSGTTYTSSTFEKGLFVAGSKEGKTATLVSQILGVFPGQTRGGVIDRPENLHILAFDESALQGLDTFLLNSCKAPKEALNYHVFNFQDDIRKVAFSKGDYGMSVYGGVIAAVEKVKALVARGGTHALLVSSLTGLAQAMQRELFGPPSVSKGQGDMNKWGKLSQMISEIRNFCQVDLWHCFFEAHIRKEASDDGEDPQDTLEMQGGARRNFAFNCAHVYRVRRVFGNRMDGYNVDQVFFDTRPTGNFLANGRGFNERLAPREPDLTVVMEKLGYKVGGWRVGK